MVVDVEWLLTEEAPMELKMVGHRTRKQEAKAQRQAWIDRRFSSMYSNVYSAIGDANELMSEFGRDDYNDRDNHIARRLFNVQSELKTLLERVAVISKSGGMKSDVATTI